VSNERVYPRETRATALILVAVLLVAVPSFLCGALFAAALLAR
jgi:hypothetical protein